VDNLSDNCLTNVRQDERLELDSLIPLSMSIKTEPISVRDFLRNFKLITETAHKKRYVIMKHGRPIGVFSPWNVAKEEVLGKAENSLGLHL
jgi:hypothetical protein